MDDDNDALLILFGAAQHGDETTLKLDAHGKRCFDLAIAFAIRAGFVERGAEAFVEALTGHLHEAELGDGQHLSLGLVTLQMIKHELVHGLLVAAVFHVDEVHNDQAAHVAEPKLAGDFLSGRDAADKDRQIAEMQERMAAMEEMLEASQKRGPGRPRKDEAA